MRIGFDASQTGAGRTGCGWYAHGLLESLASIDQSNEYLLYPTFGDSYWTTNGGSDTYHPSGGNFRRGLRHRTFEGAQTFWRNASNLEEPLGNPDIVHANNYYCPTRLRNARLVYTLYDLSFLEEPDWSTEDNRVSCFDGVFDASLHADIIVAISQHSRGRFLEHFPHFPADRVIVVPPASRFAASGPAKRPVEVEQLNSSEFWLHVGTIEPRKNLDHLFEAFATIARRGPEGRPIVLAGAHGWLLDSLQQRLEAMGIADKVLLLGYVDDESLRWLYQNCFALVAPTLYEGFGMPVLEAMGLGAPVIASSTTSIPEIVGDAALLIDPHNPGSTAEAMRILIESPERRIEMRSHGIRRAERFTWASSARTLLDCYGRAINDPRKTT